jgi:sugar phosphate permease
MTMKNQKYLKDEKLSAVLFLFLFLLYAVVYMTKNMFTSAMAIIVEEGFMTKSQTGLINAVFWLVYAPFQVVGGFAVDRYSPYKLIMIGLAGATAANIVIYFNQSYYVMMLAWVFNAIIQFGVWPGVFKIVSTQIAPEMRKKAVFWLLFSTSIGLGMSMLISSFVTHWQQNFLVSVISLIITIVAYAVLNSFLDKKMVEAEPVSQEDSKKTEINKQPMLPLMLSSGLIVFLIVCLLRVAIDNGIKMMTPVMLMESYKDLPAAISTRMSSVLIIFSAIGIFVAGFMQKNITRNEAKAQIILYAVSLLPLVVVCFLGYIHYIWILAALSVSIMLIHGAAPFSQSFVALHFENYGRIGTVSGILNATASVGNVLASYVFAKMAEIMPWRGVTTSWLVTIVVCGLLCLIVLPRWIKFTRE